MKLVLIILLLFQHGKYQIDSKQKGTVTLTPYRITINDTTRTVLPVTKVILDKGKTFYIIEGTENNISYKGAATFYHQNSIKLADNGIRKTYFLKIELRSRHKLIELRYILYINDLPTK